MDRWIGSVAIVTGATAGIGAGIAKKFVEVGINVVGLGRRIENLEKLSKEISTNKTKLYPVKCDLTDEKQILKTFKWTESALGPVSILVNNAGVFDGTCDLQNGITEVWRKTIETNCISYCICSREAIASMRRNGIDGIIINISSIAGRYVPRLPTKEVLVNLYPASKRAVNALTESLRQELRDEGSKIRVTSISPGITYTDIFRSHKEDDVKAVSTIPCIVPEDIANAALYILSTRPHVQVQEIIVRPVGETV